MLRSRVIGNNDRNFHHTFAIGTIVTLVATGLTDKESVFASVDDPGHVQVVSNKDVEPLTLTKQEAAAELAKLVANINSAISDAERVADEHGLDFSLDMAYGMGGTYYGENHEYVSGRESWADAGWNPSSQSC
jgi:hypothetical protein